MKFRYLPILAVALVAVGCSSKSGTGDTASNSDSKATTGSSTTGSSTGSTTGSSTGSTTGTTGTAPTTASSTTTGTTGSTPSSAPGAPPAASGPGAKPGSPPAAAPGAPGAAPGAAPQLTPDQQKQMAAQQAAMQAKLKENGDKAAKAKPQAVPGVKGTYKGYIDEAKIPAQYKAQAGFKDQLAKAQDQASKVTFVVSGDGSFTLNGLGPVKLTGFTSNIDGKPAIVVVNPPKPGQPEKNFAPLEITDSGAKVAFGRFAFKRS